MAYNLSDNARVAIATFGALLHSGAHARREFCVAVVGEVVTAGIASADAIVDAAKQAADYDAMEDAERALFRKQVQYCRAIATGWTKLGVANQRAFVGGSLPASSAAKLLSAKPATTSEPAPVTETASETVKVSQEAAQVIGQAEMAVHVAAWLDEADLATLSEAEAKAVSGLLDAVEAFRNRQLASIATPTRKAA